MMRSVHVYARPKHSKKFSLVDGYETEVGTDAVCRRPGHSSNGLEDVLE